MASRTDTAATFLWRLAFYAAALGACIGVVFYMGPNLIDSGVNGMFVLLILTISVMGLIIKISGLYFKKPKQGEEK